MGPLVGKLVASLVVLGMVALLGRLAGRGGGQEHPGARVLGYREELRGLGLLVGVVWPLLVLALGLFVSPPNKPGDMWAWVGLMVLPAIGGGYFLLEGFRTKVVLTPDGVAKFHWWHPPRFVAWEDVDRIDPRLRTWGDYAVRTRTGDTLGVPGPQFFGPAEWFREACREHLRPDQYPAAFNTPTSSLSK